jgi:hypothetical protein
MALGRSVFGTSIEVYRLLALGLLVMPGHPHNTRPAQVMSFMRALSDVGRTGGSDA